MSSHAVSVHTGGQAALVRPGAGPLTKACSTLKDPTCLRTQSHETKCPQQLLADTEVTTQAAAIYRVAPGTRHGACVSDPLSHCISSTAQ